MRKLVRRQAAAFALVSLILSPFALSANGASPNPALAPGATPPPGTVMPPPQPAQIDRNTALILIRTSLIAVQHANQTGNYSVLRAMSAPNFQAANSPEKLAQVFANLRAKNFDLSGVLVLDPQLSVLPQLYSNGVMRMTGFFPSVPLQVYFDLQFVPVQGQWRLLGIGVNVGAPVGSAPAATETPRPTEAPRSTETPRVLPAQPVEPQATPTPSPQLKATPIVETDGKPKRTPTPTPRRKL